MQNFRGKNIITTQDISIHNLQHCDMRYPVHGRRRISVLKVRLDSESHIKLKYDVKMQIVGNWNDPNE